MSVAQRIVAFGLLASSIAAAEPKVYPNRWVYVRNTLAREAQVAEFEQIARTASEHGLNGVLLAAGLDSIDLKPPEYLERLRRIREIAERYRLEIIPAVFGPGYGGAILSHDRNLAAGLAVRGALFVAGKDEARFVADSPPGLPKGVSGELPMKQQIRVRPYRCYRVRVRLKAEGESTATAFRIRAMTNDGKRDMARFEQSLPAAGEWREYAAAFNSWYSDSMTLDAGVSGGQSGKFVVDGLAVEEVGLTNVVRRPGAPVLVRDEKTEVVFAEGKDFAPITDPLLNFQWDHDGPAIRLLPGGRIREGARLRVDYYHGARIYRDQVVVCMSEPKVYEIWAAQIPLIEKHLAPKKYFFNHDEVRIGGHCEACRKRGMTMAQIMGDCVTRAHGLVRRANPKAEILLWSDMLDPNHNARNEYYMVDGDFTGSWEHVPKDLIIACWYHARREQSLAHFSKLGFRTLAGAYYDADDLRNPQDWLEALDQTPGAVGIMYTTWENKYRLLADFGDLVSKR